MTHLRKNLSTRRYARMSKLKGTLLDTKGLIEDDPMVGKPRARPKYPNNIWGYIRKHRPDIADYKPLPGFFLDKLYDIGISQKLFTMMCNQRSHISLDDLHGISKILKCEIIELI